MRAAIEYLFRCFEQTGSAHAVVKQFAADGLTFPGRHLGGPHHGELYWKPLRHDLVLFTLHNPRYAGAYFYGRRKQLTDINGHTRTVHKPRDQWTVLIEDAHPGYVTFEQYEHNQQTLAANAAAHSDEERRAGPAREGPALLQGLVVCGKCGKRMTVKYHKRCNGEPQPDYHCSREGIATGTPPCQSICGAGIDAAVANARARTAHPAGDRDRARGLDRARPARRRCRPDPPDGRQARRARRRGSPPTLPRRGPDQPARRRPARSRLEQQAARARRRQRRVRARHPGRQPAAHRPAASPDPRARDRPTRTVGQPGDPDAGTQTADPPARHRRHTEQDRRPDRRARPPLRRPAAHAAGATAAAGVGGAHHATHDDHADRPTAQRSHL